MIKVRIHKFNNQLRYCGYSLDEEEKLYDEQLVDILSNTRWYLDNIDKLTPYRVSWYEYKDTRPVKPHKYCRKRIGL